ncbi:MAG: hypothetical protein ACYTHN_11415, partial [Planctomycetota bacterium]
MKPFHLVLLLCAFVLVFPSCTKDDDDPPPPPANTPPSVAVTTPTAGQSGDVTISYVLTDGQGHNCTIAVEFSTDGGTNFSAATEGSGGDGTTSLTAGPAGISHTFAWDSVTDGVGTTTANATVQIRITPSDAAAGTPDTTGNFTVDNTTNTLPSVSVTTPSGTESGLVAISYTLTDAESHACSISIEYSVNGGVVYIPGTGFAGDGLSGLTSSAGGTAHTVLWNSFADGVATSASNATVRVRITPTDTLPGAPGATGNFTVDNTSIQSGSGLGAPWPIVIDPSAGSDGFSDMVSDGTYLYAVGSTTPSDEEWRIEKRRLDDGSLVNGFGTAGVVSSDPSTNSEYAESITIDATHMYVVGTEWLQTGPDSNRWRVEKRSLADGSLDTNFGTGGIVTTPGLGDFGPEKALVSSNRLYIIGFSEAGTIGNQDYQLRIEKRLLTDGSLVTAFGNNGVLEDNASTTLFDGALDFILQ